jgi:predicted nucleic acid binding AN1-type Zn finger protein
LQELDKNLKLAKRAGTLSPIKEINEAKSKMGETKTKFATPKQNKERLHTESPSPEVLMSERPTYSQSVELLQRKERGNSIIRRRKFLLHERSEQNAARR